MNNRVRIHLILAAVPCQLWEKLLIFSAKWKEGGIAGQPKQTVGESPTIHTMRIFDHQEDSVIEERLDNLLNGGDYSELKRKVAKVSNLDVQ